MLSKELGITYYHLRKQKSSSKLEEVDQYNDKITDNLHEAIEVVYNKLWKELKSDEDRITFDDIHYENDTSTYLRSHFCDLETKANIERALTLNPKLYLFGSFVAMLNWNSRRMLLKAVLGLPNPKERKFGNYSPLPL